MDTDKYYEPIITENDRCIVKVFRPILTDEERAKRIKHIEDVVGSIFNCKVKITNREGLNK